MPGPDHIGIAVAEIDLRYPLINEGLPVLPQCFSEETSLIGKQTKVVGPDTLQSMLNHHLVIPPMDKVSDVATTRLSAE